MAQPLVQSAFSAGEISPELYGEVDLRKYSSAATTLRNMVVNYRGGAMSRGGLAFVGRCLQSIGDGPPRPVPFQFSITQAYILEFGEQYMRVVYRGGYVVEAPVTITGASKASPCVLQVSGTPFADGDWVFIDDVEGMTELNGLTCIVSGAAAGHFSLLDTNSLSLNSTGFGTYTSGGTVSRIYTISTPYASEDLKYLKWSQSADVMSLTCSNPETGNEYLAYTLTRLAAADWTLAISTVAPGIDPPASISALSNSTSTINATFAYVVTAVDTNGNESIASSQAICHGCDIQVLAGSNTISWIPVVGAQLYNIYRAPPAVDTVIGADVVINDVPAGSIFGLVGSAFGTQFSDTVTAPDLAQTPPQRTNPFARGQILGLSISHRGSGLSALTYSVSTYTGSNFTANAALTGGSMGAFLIANPGINYLVGDSISFNGVGYATGAIAFGTTNPSDADTITLNGTVVTFKTTVVAANQVQIGGSLASTLAMLLTFLTASPDAQIIKCQYAVVSGALIITYKFAGTAGDFFAIAASAATPSGATLSGGAGTGVPASGNVDFAIIPNPGDTLTLNGYLITFVAGAPADAHEFQIEGNLNATIIDLCVNLLTPSTDVRLSVASYLPSTPGPNAFVNVTYKTEGTVGNAYTLAASAAAPSAATLLGGVDGEDVPVATLTIGPDSGTYPAVSAFFQQRLFYANTFNNPDTFFASQPGRFSNFDKSIPTIATDAITASPWTEQVNGIQWLIPMPGGLIAMTGLRAWQIIGEGGYNLNPQPITPSTVQAQPEAFNGCSATVPPIVVDYDVLYKQSIGNAVNDLAWNALLSIYTGNDLTILSNHLFQFQAITQWCWALQPYKVVWACTDYGTMLSLTYLKDQEVYGWARHDTQGVVVGMAAIDEPPVNAVYAIVTRYPPYAPSGTFFMERMDNRLWQSVENTYAVDSGVSNPMTTPDASITASAPSGAGVSFVTSADVFTSGGQASGTIAFSVNPSPGDTITLNGYLITFVAGAPGNVHEYQIGGTTFFTIDGLATFLNASVDPLLSVATYVGLGPGPGTATLQVTYDAGGGGGNSYTLAASAATPSGSHLTGGGIGIVGSILRMSGGIATVTAYVSARQVTGTWNLACSVHPLGVPYAPSGGWTVSSPVSVLYAPHLSGMTLVGLGDGVPMSGLSCTGQLGIVTLPFAASDVKVGLPYTAQLQTPYLNGNAVTQGARKVIPAATVRVHASGNFQYGVNQIDAASLDPAPIYVTWSNLTTADLTKSTGGQTPPTTYTSPGGQTVTPIWTGDLRVVGGGSPGWNSKGQVAVQQTQPLPLQVIAVMPEILPGDLPEVVQRRQPAAAPRPPGRHMLNDPGG